MFAFLRGMVNGLKGFRPEFEDLDKDTTMQDGVRYFLGSAIGIQLGATVLFLTACGVTFLLIECVKYLIS